MCDCASFAICATMQGLQDVQALRDILRFLRYVRFCEICLALHENPLEENLFYSVIQLYV